MDFSSHDPRASENGKERLLQSLPLKAPGEVVSGTNYVCFCSVRAAYSPVWFRISRLLPILQTGQWRLGKCECVIYHSCGTRKKGGGLSFNSELLT